VYRPSQGAECTVAFFRDNWRYFKDTSFSDEGYNSFPCFSNKRAVALGLHENQTPLMIACRLGREAAVKLLLEQEADARRQAEYVNSRSSHGVTALMLASSNGVFSIVEMLLAAGATIGIKSKCGSGETAFTAAVVGGARPQWRVSTLLLTKGINLADEPACSE
jgi:ankyrin repeat protein